MCRRRRRRIAVGACMPVKKSDAIWRKIFSLFSCIKSQDFDRPYVPRFEWPRIRNYCQLPPALRQKKSWTTFPRILAEVNYCRIVLTAFLPLLTFRIFHPTLFSSRKKRGTAAITSFFYGKSDTSPGFTPSRSISRLPSNKTLPPAHLTKLHAKSHDCISYKKRFARKKIHFCIISNIQDCIFSMGKARKWFKCIIFSNLADFSCLVGGKGGGWGSFFHALKTPTTG